VSKLVNIQGSFILTLNVTVSFSVTDFFWQKGASPLHSKLVEGDAVSYGAVVPAVKVHAAPLPSALLT
jgi:hypothetical protein